MFFVLCYACNNFGHKVVNCRANNMNINYFEIHTQKGYPRRPSETQRRSYNRFESLSIKWNATNVTTLDKWSNIAE
jgi:hypothetical protein